MYLVEDIERFLAGEGVLVRLHDVFGISVKCELPLGEIVVKDDILGFHGNEFEALVALCYRFVVLEQIEDRHEKQHKRERHREDNDDDMVRDRGGLLRDDRLRKHRGEIPVMQADRRKHGDKVFLSVAEVNDALFVSGDIRPGDVAEQVRRSRVNKIGGSGTRKHRAVLGEQHIRAALGKADGIHQRAEYALVERAEHDTFNLALLFYGYSEDKHLVALLVHRCGIGDSVHAGHRFLEIGFEQYISGGHTVVVNGGPGRIRDAYRLERAYALCGHNGAFHGVVVGKVDIAEITYLRFEHDELVVELGIEYRCYRFCVLCEICSGGILDKSVDASVEPEERSGEYYYREQDSNDSRELIFDSFEHFIPALYVILHIKYREYPTNMYINTYYIIFQVLFQVLLHKK